MGSRLQRLLPWSTLADPYRLLLLLAMAFYCYLFAGLAIELHSGMRTHRSDLGQIAQAVWNSSHGRFVEMTDNGFVATRLTDHVEPILVLISPIFWFWEDVRALLVLQALVVALGAWPLYELALRRLDTLLSPREQQQIWQLEPLRQMTRPLAFVAALAYLLTPQLQSALLTEFHAAPLAVPLILWAFWAIDARRPWQMAVSIILVAAVKEEMALLAAGLALWALWRAIVEAWQLRYHSLHQPDPQLHSKGQDRYPRHRFVLPVLLAGFALLWFYIATFVIVPAHAVQVYETEQSVYFERYGALGNSPLDIAKSFVTQPQVVWQIATEPARRQYWWGLLAPFGFLSLLAPEILLLSLPLLLANLLSAYPAQYYGDFHYSAPLIPYSAVSALYGLARLWRWSGRRTQAFSANFQHMPAASTGIMTLVSFLTNARTALRPLITLAFLLWLFTWSVVTYLHVGRGPWGGHYDDPTLATVTTYGHQRLLPYFVAQIPRNAAVTATAAVHPHVSLRRYVYQFPLGLPELGTAGQADWALLDVTTNTDMAPGDLKGAVETMLAGEWGIIDGTDGFLLLRRGATARTIPTAFYDFARVAPGGEEPLSSEVGTQTQLLRTTVHQWARWRETRVTAEWHVGAEGGQSFEPMLDLVDPNGALLFNLTTAAPPALVWYPPTSWQPGEQIRVTTLPLWLPRFWGIVTRANAVQSQIVLAQSEDGTRALVNFLRQTDDGLIEVPVPAGTPPLATTFQANPATAIFQDELGNELLSLRSWVSRPTITPGQPWLLWLRWRGATWPAQKSVFVHLRLNSPPAGDNGGETFMQLDGAPRFFVYPNAEQALAQSGVLEDLRKISLPETLAPGSTVTAIVGLYDWESGERLEIVDREGRSLGNEWITGQFVVSERPIPDQACALIGVSCAAQ